MMRNFGIAMIAVAASLAGISPAVAAPGRGTIVNDGPQPLPHVRINRPGPRAVIGRQMPMRDRFDTRDYRADPVYPDRYRPDRYRPDRYRPDRYRPDRYRPDRYRDDRYGRNEDYGHEDYGYEDDYDDRRQVEYGDARDIDYDRDYPYDHPYGGQSSDGHGFGGYTMIETITTTTTPTIVKQIEYVEVPVAVHAPKRYKATRRVQRTARRSIKGPRR